MDHGQETRDEVHIAFRDQHPDSTGDRPTVVLLHGSPGDNGAFWALGPDLADHFRVIAPDLPGFGGSTREIPDYSIVAHAHYVLQLLDSLHIKQAHIVGFSLGGGVALNIAQLAPDRVRSLTLLSSIGAQEYELAGEYHLNHAIHGLQLAGLWGLRELVPHFGLLDDGMLSVEYARNFYETDQRPLRKILSHYAGPMLILHGVKDPLVTPAAAHEHARLVPQSELVMYRGDHFMVFQHPEMIEEPLTEFIQRVEAGKAATRATAEPQRLAAAARPFDPRRVPPTRGLALVILLFLIAAATLVSEDLTCVATGLLIARGTLAAVPGTLACFVGIFVGDVLLYLTGRWLGRAILYRAPLRWFLRPEDVERSSQWFRQRGAPIVFATRLLPGTRLPTYFAAGMLQTSFWRFTGYFFVACALWTPLLVGFSAAVGESAQMVLGAVRSRAWTWLLITALVTLPAAQGRGASLLLARPSSAALPVAADHPLGVLASVGVLSSGRPVRAVPRVQIPQPDTLHRRESGHPGRRFCRRIQGGHPGGSPPLGRVRGAHQTAPQRTRLRRKAESRPHLPAATRIWHFQSCSSRTSGSVEQV